MMMKKILPVLFACIGLAASCMNAPRSDGEKPENPLVFVIPIHGEINKSLTVFVRRSIEKATEAHARYIIFDIDTFGGAVDSALQITTLIGSIDKAETIAFVPITPEGTGVSWSAGAIISFSCKKIFMAAGTSIGAAAPVFQGAQGMEMAPEKVVSAVRTQMAAIAEKNGYPKGAALAMVDQEIELVEVTVDGKLELVTTDEAAELEKDAKKKGITVERGNVVSPKGKLLSLTALEMEKYGISSGTVTTKEELMAKLDVKEPRFVATEQTSADQLVAFITSAAISGILILIGLVALYIEVTTPGFGIPGTIAIICFAVLFASQFLLGNVGSLEIIFFLVGIVLIVLEIFVIPGFGFVGITGILSIAIALILSMQDFVIPTFDWQWPVFRTNIIVVLVDIIAAFVVIIVAGSFIPRFPAFNRLALRLEQTTDSGFTVQTNDEVARFEGKSGTSVTVLRPAGKADIDGETIHVEAEGEFIEANTPVRVVRIDSNRIIVRKV
jgi:membrane-bound serine protease (ClpP class)